MEFACFRRKGRVALAVVHIGRRRGPLVPAACPARRYGPRHDPPAGSPYNPGIGDVAGAVPGQWWEMRMGIRRALLWVAAAGCGLGLCRAGAQAPADATPGPDPAAEVALLDRLGPDARLRRTDHFLIAYDTPEETIRSLVSRLEATYRAVFRVCAVNGIPAEHPGERLEVLCFHRFEDYARFAAESGFAAAGTAGFYNQANNLAAFVNVLNLPELSALNRSVETHRRRLDTLRAARPSHREALDRQQRQWRRLAGERDRFVERANRLTVQHEAAHQILFNAGVHVRGAQNPGWLVEGLACLFETPPSRWGAGPGATNQMRLGDFRSSLGGGDPSARLRPDDIQRAFESGTFVPLRELVGEADLFSRREDPNLVYHYCQAWSLVCYLQRAHRLEFAEYTRRLAGRRPGERLPAEAEIAEFEDVFGPLDERFERRWARYVLSLRFRPGER